MAGGGNHQENLCLAQSYQRHSLPPLLLLTCRSTLVTCIRTCKICCGYVALPPRREHFPWIVRWVECYWGWARDSEGHNGGITLWGLFSSWKYSLNLDYYATHLKSISIFEIKRVNMICRESSSTHTYPGFVIRYEQLYFLCIYLNLGVGSIYEIYSLSGLQYMKIIKTSTNRLISENSPWQRHLDNTLRSPVSRVHNNTCFFVEKLIQHRQNISSNSCIPLTAAAAKTDSKNQPLIKVNLQRHGFNSCQQLLRANQ